MATKLTKPYRLHVSQKHVLAEYLQGKRSQADTASYFDVSRQNLPNITNSIFRHLVSTGKIDITQLIKDY